MKINKKLKVEYYGSRIVGCMARETPYIIFSDSEDQNKKYYWTSDTIEAWEYGCWPKWDGRKGHKINFKKGTILTVIAFVRPDEKTLYKIDLTSNF